VLPGVLASLGRLAGRSPHEGKGAIPKNPWKREMEAKGSLGIAKAGIEVRDSTWSNLK
jgi:hypothetical protein